MNRQKKKLINLEIELLFKNEGKIKTFPGEQKRREFVASTPTVREIVMEVLQAESKEPQMLTPVHENKERW